MKLSSRCLYSEFRTASQILAHRRLCPRSFVSRHYATISGVAADAEQPPPPPKNPFPYPTTTRPTPYQLFHLSSGATQAQIKSRYYELVKVHHPDSQYTGHLSPDVAHARFQAIQGAYDFLRGKTLSPHPNARPASRPGSADFNPYMHELARRRRAYYAHHGGYRRSYEAETASDGWAKPGWGEGFGAPPNQRTVWHQDGWRERMILAFGVMWCFQLVPDSNPQTLLAGLFPSLPFAIASVFTSPSSTSSSSSSKYIAPTSTSAAPLRHNSASGTDSAASASDPANSFSVPFLDLDKNHREAVSALQQVRHERKEIGSERREGVRKRVREMTMAEAPDRQPQSCSTPSGVGSAQTVLPAADAIDKDQ
ncbi:hypothetical protein CVT26_008871 [Gymnopilus dilepis]|uniref:J domain-containing protein n=1 Tax=Gymnopilus dilepis TaxID=231916 RepID=A0A409YAS6_9AGAR|nr:hypothetical protein CVT26_008871 [Gymnopilus dilepis]